MDAVCRTNHAEHDMAEITHGFNGRFECGFCIFTFITEGQSRPGDLLDRHITTARRHQREKVLHGAVECAI